MDKPAIAIPSPVLYVGAFVLGDIGQFIWRVPMPEERAALWLGLLFFALGVAVSLQGLIVLARNHTPVDPSRPVTAVVTQGPYRWSRNPLYLGQTAMYLGAALFWHLTWSVILLVPVVLIVHYKIIKPEEAYLQKKFPDTYPAYQRRVRRWL